jgi:hypothetical protein
VSATAVALRAPGVIARLAVLAAAYPAVVRAAIGRLR